jgi:two-component system, chemotaxis family, chemotaxis protein CheY
MMIVDDSNMIRTRIAKIVTDGRIGSINVVGLAKNGVDAVRIARVGNPEVVTMDLTMPEMDGLPCIEALIKLNPKISILVVSALNDKSTAIAALKAGAKGFVAKPFSDAELLMALMDMAEK